MLLYEGGYSHNDLHSGNMMINKTDNTYFDFYGKKIKYNGYQISVIDYGEVMHTKFGKKDTPWKNMFSTNRTEYMFFEMYYTTINIVNNFGKYIDDCNKKKKEFPWVKHPNLNDDVTKKILAKHGKFFYEASKKYVKLFPKSEKLMNVVLKKINGKKTIGGLVNEDNNSSSFWFTIGHVIEEFNVKYPKIIRKIFWLVHIL